MKSAYWEGEKKGASKNWKRGEEEKKGKVKSYLFSSRRVFEAHNVRDPFLSVVVCGVDERRSGFGTWRMHCHPSWIQVVSFLEYVLLSFEPSWRPLVTNQTEKTKSVLFSSVCKEERKNARQERK
jgi:hypothetical protein